MFPARGSLSHMSKILKLSLIGKKKYFRMQYTQLPFTSVTFKRGGVVA